MGAGHIVANVLFGFFSNKEIMGSFAMNLNTQPSLTVCSERSGYKTFSCLIVGIPANI